MFVKFILSDFQSGYSKDQRLFDLMATFKVAFDLMPNTEMEKNVKSTEG